MFRIKFIESSNCSSSFSLEMSLFSFTLSSASRFSSFVSAAASKSFSSSFVGGLRKSYPLSSLVSSSSLTSSGRLSSNPGRLGSVSSSPVVLLSLAVA